jgi:hypothetical protein
MSDNEKHQAVQSMHLGILQNSAAAIRQQWDASVATGKQVSDIVMVMMHTSEDIMPEEIRAACGRDNLQVAVFAVDRLKFSAALHEYQPDGSEDRPYEPASLKLQNPPSDSAEKFYAAVFAAGMCTIIEGSQKRLLDPSLPPTSLSPLGT